MTTDFEHFKICTYSKNWARVKHKIIDTTVNFNNNKLYRFAEEWLLKKKTSQYILHNSNFIIHKNSKNKILSMWSECLIAVNIYIYIFYSVQKVYHSAN